jgi:hypothetical protein
LVRRPPSSDGRRPQAQAVDLDEPSRCWRSQVEPPNVLKAWKQPGFVGAKLYPPMGFYPSGNTGKNGKAIDDALAQFYHECIYSDAVVLAHAGPSYCAKSGRCEYPGPKAWVKAIDGVFDTEHKPLRAALGHFGGPFDKEAPEYPCRRIVRRAALITAGATLAAVERRQASASRWTRARPLLCPPRSSEDEGGGAEVGDTRLSAFRLPSL